MQCICKIMLWTVWWELCKLVHCMPPVIPSINMQYNNPVCLFSCIHRHCCVFCSGDIFQPCHWAATQTATAEEDFLQATRLCPLGVWWGLIKMCCCVQVVWMSLTQPTLFLSQARPSCALLRWTSTSPPGAGWSGEPYPQSAPTPSALRCLRLGLAACPGHQHPPGRLMKEIHNFSLSHTHRQACITHIMMWHCPFQWSVGDQAGLWQRAHPRT